MAEIVAHPETGRPAVVETSYRELELDQERSKLSDLEAQKSAKADEAERVNKELAALESAVSEQKSLVTKAESIAPQPNDTAGEAGNGGEVATDGASADSVEPADEPAGDTAEATPVVVEVVNDVDPSDEY